MFGIGLFSFHKQNLRHFVRTIFFSKSYIYPISFLTFCYLSDLFFLFYFDVAFSWLFKEIPKIIINKNNAWLWTVYLFNTVKVSVHCTCQRWSRFSWEWLSYEWETYGTDLQYVHGTTCRNTEIASHKNGYRMSGKHTVLTYSTYTVRHAVTLK